MLNVVGDRLSEWAQQEPSQEDSFARSAFNRYYYASFLAVRELLAEINPKWQTTRHACIPSLLKGKAFRTIKGELQRARQGGLITKGQQAGLKHRALTALSDLSNTLRRAYNLRVTADYEPEERIRRVGADLFLRETKLSSAGSWPSTTHRLVGTVRGVRKEVGSV